VTINGRAHLKLLQITHIGLGWSGILDQKEAQWHHRTMETTLILEPSALESPPPKLVHLFFRTDDAT